MCHYTIKACRNDHEVSKRRKCRHCSSWKEGIDSASCKYEAALEAGEVEREFIQSRVCEECVREIIEDMKAKQEQSGEEEAVESKEKCSESKRDLLKKNVETISKTDRDEAPSIHAEHSNQLHVKAPTGVELENVEKAPTELVEAESTSTKSQVSLGDVGSSSLRNLERNAGSGQGIQGSARSRANMNLASTNKKQSVGGKSSDAPGTKRISDFKLKGIPEPVIR